MIPKILYAVCDRNNKVKFFVEFLDDAVKLGCQNGFYNLILLDDVKGNIQDNISTDDVIFQKYCEIRCDLKKKYKFYYEWGLECEAVLKTASYFEIDSTEVRYAILNFIEKIYG